MKPHTNHLSFGRYLRAIRNEKEMGLEEISEEIKVATSVLRLIEKEEHNNLPAEVSLNVFPGVVTISSTKKIW